MPRRKTPAIFAVSDSRGETASQVVRAAALQFKGKRYRLLMRPRVRSVDQVEQIVDQAAAERGVIFYTLVEDDTRNAMRVLTIRHSVPAIDVRMSVSA